MSDDETLSDAGEWLERGRCDTCGAPCSEVDGLCTRDPAHEVALS